MKDKKLMIARVILTALTVAAVAAIFFNSSQSAIESSERSSPLTDWVNGILSGLSIPFSVTEKFIRKLAHFTEYAILGTMLSVTYYLYLLKIRTALISTLITGAAIAVIDEIIQLFSEGRSCRISDMLLDFSGVAFASVIVMLIVRAKANKRRKKQLDAVSKR